MATIRRRRKFNIRGIALVLAALILVATLVFSAVKLVGDVRAEFPAPPTTGTTAATTATTVTTTVRTLPGEFVATNLRTPSAYLYDVTNGVELFAKDADSRRYPASITKMLTGAVAMKYLDIDAPITVGEELSLVARDSSTAGLKRGWVMTVRDLLYAMLLPSGNDAAYVLAVAAARAELNTPTLAAADAVERFAALMNQTLASIGAVDSHFVTPDGYHHPEHYTTARDLAKILTYSLQNEEVRAVLCTRSITCTLQSGQTVRWTSTNMLLDENGPYYCPYVLCGKTGSTSEAGNCLFVLAEKDGREVIAIVLKAANNGIRFGETKALIELGLQ